MLEAISGSLEERYRCINEMSRSDGDELSRMVLWSRLIAIRGFFTYGPKFQVVCGTVSFELTHVYVLESRIIVYMHICTLEV